MSRRYRLRASAPQSDADATAFAALVHDRMTEQARICGCSLLPELARWSCERSLTIIAAACKAILQHITLQPVTASSLRRRTLNVADSFHTVMQVYEKPLATFASDMEPGPVITVPVMQHGRQALEDISQVCAARQPSVSQLTNPEAFCSWSQQA